MSYTQRNYSSKVCCVKTNVYICHKIKPHTNMTLEIFLQLLKDTSKGKDVFDRFLKKNRSTFDTIINIKYSSKRYEDVDVAGIYYKDFMKFTINQLEIEKKSIPFNTWITELAKQRANFIRPMVRRSLAKVLLEKGGKENWDFLNEIIHTDFTPTCNKIVFRYFDNPRFQGLHEEVKSSLMALFYMSRGNNPAPITKEIRNIEAYIYQMLANFSKKKKTRTQIYEELGLDHDDIDIEKYNKSDENDLDSSEDELLVDELSPNDIDCNDDVNDGVTPSIGESFLHEISSNEDRIWAEKEIEKLLSLFPAKKREEAELIRKIKLLEYEPEELAEEEGCSVKYMYVRIKRAMTTLSVVALPYIKERCKKMFLENVDELNNEYYKNILSDFFLTDKDWQELSSLYHKPKKILSEDLIDAFKAIKTKNKEKDTNYSSDSDIKTYLENEQLQDAEKSKIIILNPKNKKNNEKA